AGFTLGASYGEDNYWDAALRYAGEFNGIRIAGAVGYSVWSEFDDDHGALICTSNCDKDVSQLTGSLSIRHMPTGLFFTGAAGDRDVDDDAIGGDFSSRFFYLSGGIARNYFGIGDTVLYGEYSEWKGAAQDSVIALGPVAGPGTSSDKLQHWGIGVVQHVDAAA